jgi:1-deoxy-D-xylulose 5-phosphate reductoisomerase
VQAYNIPYLYAPAKSIKMSVKRIAIFGSTGSIGTQCLEVIAANPDLFSAEILTAQNNDELLVQQAIQFNPNLVVIGDEKIPKSKRCFSTYECESFCRRSCN